MKIPILRAPIIVALLCFAFISCKKSTHIKTKTELIAQSSWKFDHATATGFGDITSQVPACYKDNVIVFASNGTGNVDESTNVCSPTTAGPFTWSFQTNETILHISTVLFSGGTTDFTLVTLNETNLVISQLVVLPPPASIMTTVEFTLKH